MDFMNSVTWGKAFNSVWGQIRVKMTETFNVFILINTKCYVLRSSLFATKLKIICKNLVTKSNPISRLFIHWAKNKLWSETQTILTCTSQWPGCNSAKLNLYQFPLCSVASQLDVVRLSSNVFPSCTIQNNCGNFFNLDSRFAKAGSRLRPFYMEVGVTGLVRWPA